MGGGHSDQQKPTVLVQVTEQVEKLSIKNHIRSGSAFHRGARCPLGPLGLTGMKKNIEAQSHPLPQASLIPAPPSPPAANNLEHARGPGGRPLLSGEHLPGGGPCPNVSWVPSFTKRAGSTPSPGNRLWRPERSAGERGGEKGLGVGSGKHMPACPPPPRPQPPGIKRVEGTGARSGRRERDLGAKEGRGQGRRGGAPRRGVAGAQGEGAGRRGCSPRSRLWGLGFAGLRALGRELEPGTELRSQRSHRDERRSRRLGFSRRPAPSVRPPDRWASAAATGPRPLRCLCPGELQLAGVFRERWLPAPSARALQPPERFEATLELSCVQPRSPARGAASPWWWWGCSAGVSREWGQRAGGFGVSEVQAEGAGCVLVWGLLLCRGSGGSHPALSPPCEARPSLPFVKS